MLKAVEWKQKKLFMIDQTKLPGKVARIQCRTPEQVAEAVRTLKLRGTSALGVAAAFAIYLGVKRPPMAKTFEALLAQINKISNQLGKLRPTTMNLFWALERMKRCAVNNRDHKLSTLRDILLREALSILREDERLTKTISELGAELIRDGDTVLTAGNSGSLSTASLGTGLGMLMEAAHKRKDVKILVAETRPNLQGGRLTAYELKTAKLPFQLIADNMAAALMKRGLIHVLVLAASRVAMNGDVASKIGSYGLAMLAYHHHIPVYLAAPISTFDRSLSTGDLIPIEERPIEELTMMHGKHLSIKGVKAINLAFDVTPHRYLSALITELGVVRAPFDQNLKNLFSNLV